MGCVKCFSSIDDQVRILKSRKLHIEDEDKVKKILMRENYYNVVNGYKEPFLMRNQTGDRIEPEEFIEGCDFSELYSLSNFDRELRGIIVGYLLKFEAHIKTQCAYNFSEIYRSDYSYLSAENYSKEKKDLSSVLSNLATLSREVDKSKSVYVLHYKKNYDCVPLWVLVNALTLGNISYFYDALENSLKDKIARNFSIEFKYNYDSSEKISTGEMKDILKIVVLFRNACAHDEVLFLYKLVKPIAGSSFTKYFTSPKVREALLQNSNLFTLICILKLVLLKEEFYKLIIDMKKLFEEYDKRFHVVKLSQIIEMSGFMNAWFEELYK